MSVTFPGSDGAQDSGKNPWWKMLKTRFIGTSNSEPGREIVLPETAPVNPKVDLSSAQELATEMDALRLSNMVTSHASAIQMAKVQIYQTLLLKAIEIAIPESSVRQIFLNAATPIPTLNLDILPLGQLAETIRITFMKQVLIKAKITISFGPSALSGQGVQINTSDLSFAPHETTQPTLA